MADLSRSKNLFRQKRKTSKHMKKLHQEQFETTQRTHSNKSAKPDTYYTTTTNTAAATILLYVTGVKVVGLRRRAHKTLTMANIYIFAPWSPLLVNPAAIG
ncbi:hypothetical protein T03_11680 [Trichinella britovi]|uniref:Uncharacterized protein n=1 Tax=Trichinella britovi TaxID=45882 RepID=A0A0V1D8B9_TRIBR|nr:hypothetical protein T03_11680 [Trichinella britovi]